MMRHIRPHELFCRVKTDSYAERLMTIVMPDDQTPRLLDTAVLVALCRLVQPHTIYEFGTGRGIQTINLTLAAPGVTVYTVDLPDPALAEPEDRELAEGLRKLPASSSEAHLSRWWGIGPICGDSRSCDLPPTIGPTVVYVDGGHAESVVRSDTARALDIVRPDGGAIAWHDYSPEWPGVVQVLDELAEHEDLEHVEETSLVLWGARR